LRSPQRRVVSTMTSASAFEDIGHSMRAARIDSSSRSRWAASLKIRPFQADVVSNTASPRRKPTSKIEILACSRGTYSPLT
jgi:hypothetical protein